MNQYERFAIAYLNGLTSEQAKEAIFHCCGSKVFRDCVCSARPFENAAALQQVVTDAFDAMSTQDWLEAFTHHPQIGDVDSIRKKFASTAHLASTEQSGVAGASEETFRELAEFNARYLEKFGFIFIICATGLTAEFMLAALKARIVNEMDVELKNAAEEQKKITWIRLAKAGQT